MACPYPRVGYTTPMTTLHTLWGKYKDDGLELLVAWDDYSVDGNGEGFEEACEEAEKARGDELVATRMVEVEVDLEAIEALFETGKVAGKVRTESD